MKFYEFSQNNSGGSFDVDSKICHRLFIEAESSESANQIAEELGCYWNGVDAGMDCPCCGDRWYSGNLIDFANINDTWQGYEVSKWLHGKIDESIEIANLKADYPNSIWTVEPTIENKYSSFRVSGKIRIDSIEQYAQLMANLYGWTKPDCRIFYANGEVKEIFSTKIK